MKKQALLVIFILSACSVLAQTTVTPTVTNPNVTPPVSSIMPNTVNSTPVQSSANKLKRGIVLANTITENVEKAKTFSKFFKAIQTAGLTETFKSTGPITLFAPNDQAFEKVPGKLDTLLRPDHKFELIAFITYHAVAGKLTSRDIIKQISRHKNLATFTTISGGKLTAKIGADRNLVLIDENGGQSTITQKEMMQSNGVLFVVNTVLLPKNRLL